MNRVILIFASLLLLSSCLEDEPWGGGEDTIKFSTREVNLTSKLDSVIVTSEGDYWGLDEIVFEDSTYAYYLNKDLDTRLNSFIIEENSFTVERRDKNTLYVELNENITGEDRVMTLYFSEINSFPSITVRQLAN